MTVITMKNFFFHPRCGVYFQNIETVQLQLKYRLQHRKADQCMPSRMHRCGFPASCRHLVDEWGALIEKLEKHFLKSLR